MFNKTSSSLKRIFLVLALILSSACSSEFKPATFKISSIDETFVADISVTYDKAIGDNQLSKTINNNLEKAIVLSMSSSETEIDLIAALNTFDNDYKTFKTEFPDASSPAWELNIETEISYQSEDIITFAINTYEYQGGAHGNDKIEFLNLNAKTGDILNLNDLIENKVEFNALAEKYFLKTLDSREENLKMEDFFFGKPFQLPENIGYSEEGVILLYNTYEVASYAQGYTEFVIPFEEVEPYLKIN